MPKGDDTNSVEEITSEELNRSKKDAPNGFSPCRASTALDTTAIKEEITIYRKNPNDTTLGLDNYDSIQSQ